MAVIRGITALTSAYSDIVTSPGSPYYMLDAQVMCGGRTLVPTKVNLLEIGNDYTQDYAESIHLTMTFPVGDLIHYIAPYGDDIRVSLKYKVLNDKMNEQLGVGLLRTYTGYIASEVPTPSTMGGSPHLSVVEEANRMGFMEVIFRLEEIAIGQLKRMSYGLDFENTVPINAVLALLDHSVKKLKLPVDQNFKGIDVTEADNQSMRYNIIIEDGTDLLDIPDYIQNEEGGIYSTGLGFFLLRDYIYLWPLYHTTRSQESSRLLRVYISPDYAKSQVDHSWKEEGRRLDIWCSHQVSRKDDSRVIANVEGTGSRFMDTRTLLNGFANIEDGKVVVKRGRNSGEFAGKESVKGEQYLTNTKRNTSNIYLEASRLASRQGSIFVVTWNHSDPSKIRPNMSVEIIYDREGVARKVNATLLGVLSQIATDGKAQNNLGAVSQTVISLFVSSKDANYEDWVSGGAVGSSIAPTIE